MVASDRLSQWTPPANSAVCWTGQSTMWNAQIRRARYVIRHSAVPQTVIVCVSYAIVSRLNKYYWPRVMPGITARSKRNFTDRLQRQADLLRLHSVAQKIWEGKNVKIWRDFAQLLSLTANISVVDIDIENWKKA